MVDVTQKVAKRWLTSPVGGAVSSLVGCRGLARRARGGLFGLLLSSVGRALGGDVAESSDKEKGLRAPVVAQSFFRGCGEALCLAGGVAPPKFPCFGCWCFSGFVWVLPIVPGFPIFRIFRIFGCAGVAGQV